jgi:hypothetical protein
MAKQATLAKAEKKKTNLSLPMRGRHMFIGDKTRDQYMRCEFFKQANENEEVMNEQKNLRFLDHVKHYEDQIASNKDLKKDIVVQALQKKSLRDFKPLMTKAFDFSSKEVQMHQSANNIIGEKSAFNV